jgi:hypothetical protein
VIQVGGSINLFLVPRGELDAARLGMATTLLQHLRCRLPAAIRCTPGATGATPSFTRMQCYSSKPSRFGGAKKRTQVLEKARRCPAVTPYRPSSWRAPWPCPASASSTPLRRAAQPTVRSPQLSASRSTAGAPLERCTRCPPNPQDADAAKGDWTASEASRAQQSAPTQSTFPSYADVRERQQQQSGSQLDNLSGGVVEHMRKVYATLGIGIGISAGASIFAMATPLGARRGRAGAGEGFASIFFSLGRAGGQKGKWCAPILILFFRFPLPRWAEAGERDEPVAALLTACPTPKTNTQPRSQVHWH